MTIYKSPENSSHWVDFSLRKVRAQGLVVLIKKSEAPEVGGVGDINYQRKVNRGGWGCDSCAVDFCRDSWKSNLSRSYPKFRDGQKLLGDSKGSH